jgi:tryptophan synthase alpha chain
MSRLADRFARLRAAGRKALIPYVTAGDPAPGITVPLMQAMAAAGADVIELGVPFSDPMADGPVIQRASERALRHHVSLRTVLDMVRDFRRSDAATPVVLMGYLNPIEAMGYAAFATAAAEAGVDGVLTVDLPPEEAGELLAALQSRDLAPIFLIAPNTTAERLRAISAAARGFIYYVSLKGVTGAAHLDIESVRNKVAEIRRGTDLPVGVGFGIRDAAAAAAVAAVADAVVVGSALVKIIEEAGNDTAAVTARVSARLTEMRQAIDDARGRR